MKIVNPSLGISYRKEYDYCEACAKLEGKFPVRSRLELHHIYGGDYRTDEQWNYIVLCHEHHERATTHNLEYGAGSLEWNIKYLGIKYLKLEITDEKLKELKKYEETVKQARIIAETLPYWFGIRCGYYDR